MSNQLQTVESVIVLMLENRGFDNVMGFLHTDDGNKTPNGDPYNGLTGDETNPANSDGTSLVPVQREMNDSTVPDPDPHEQFDFVTKQLFIPDGMYNKRLRHRLRDCQERDRRRHHALLRRVAHAVSATPRESLCSMRRVVLIRAEPDVAESLVRA